MPDRRPPRHAGQKLYESWTNATPSPKSPMRRATAHHVMLHQGPERCRVVFLHVFTIPNWGFFLGILWSPGNGMFLLFLMTLKHSWSMEPGECQWDGLGFRVYHIRTVAPSLKLKSSSRFLFCRPCLEKFGPLQSLLREEI